LPALLLGGAAALVAALSGRARIILFDKRGTGATMRALERELTVLIERTVAGRGVALT
jgi:hypothetical protein